MTPEAAARASTSVWHPDPMAEEPHAPYIRHSDGTVSEGHTATSAPKWLSELDGRNLSYISVSHQTLFNFDDFAVGVESPFSLTISPGTQYQFDPSDRGSLGPVLELYPTSLVRVSVEGAALHLEFAGGATITAPPNDHYEAWYVNGPGDQYLVCTPGGRFAIWP